MLRTSRHSVLGHAVGALLASCAASMRMSDDVPAGEPGPDEQPPAQAVPAAAAQQDSADTASFSVPVEHADLLERILNLLNTGEQWVLDNIHAGVTTLEGLLPGADKLD